MITRVKSGCSPKLCTLQTFMDLLGMEIVIRRKAWTKYNEEKAEAHQPDMELLRELDEQILRAERERM